MTMKSASKGTARLHLGTTTQGESMDAISLELARRISAARLIYGPYTSTHEALGVACEEWDELRAAVHANDLSAIRRETLDLAACLIKLATDLDNSALIRRSVKSTET